ncbi:MAG TPA: hypothetical protein VIP56_09290, partial [Nitrososphaeraceae archaeon]
SYFFVQLDRTNHCPIPIPSPIGAIRNGTKRTKTSHDQITGTSLAKETFPLTSRYMPTEISTIYSALGMLFLFSN